MKMPLVPTNNNNSSPANEATISEKNSLQTYSVGKKLCVILDQHLFENVDDNRHGSEVDRFRLYEVFTKNLGFNVILRCNLNKEEMDKTIGEVQNICKNQDLLVMIVLSHGDTNAVWTVDGFTRDVHKDFITKFTGNIMKDKPKVFIFQACRGGKADCSIHDYSDTLLVDGPSEPIPETEAKEDGVKDVLVAFSTLPGCFSQRNHDYGSIYIYFLSYIFQTYFMKHDVVTMLTMVSQFIAEKTMLQFNNGGTFQIMPNFKSYLTKKLYLIDLIPGFPQLKKIGQANICPEDQFYHELICPNFCAEPSMKYSQKEANNVCLIINQMEFTGTGNKIYSEWRSSNEKSSEQIKTLFKDFLKFNVAIVNNLSVGQMKNIISRPPPEFQKVLSNLKTITCLVIFVLTNGDEQKMWATDKKMSIDEIVSPFIGKQCVNLSGKPKILFIQACGGGIGPSGQCIDEGKTGEPIPLDWYKIKKCDKKNLPSNSDVLISYSTFNETQFIGTLCDVFQANHMKHDLVEMLTIANQRLDDDFSCGNVPWFASRLRKKLYFMPCQQPTTDNADCHSLLELKTPSNDLHGLCLIFNQTVFDGHCHKQNDDCQRLKSLFQKYQFRVSIYINKTMESIEEVLYQASVNNNREFTRCLVIIVLSHANDKEEVRTSNKFLKIEKFLVPFQKPNCPLVKKEVPKVFIIQACRPDLKSLNDDNFKSIDKMICQNEFLAYAVSTGSCSSYEEILGSPFVRQFCRGLEKRNPLTLNSFAQKSLNSQNKWQIKDFKVAFEGVKTQLREYSSHLTVFCCDKFHADCKRKKKKKIYKILSFYSDCPPSYG